MTGGPTDEQLFDVMRHTLSEAGCACPDPKMLLFRDADEPGHGSGWVVVKHNDSGCRFYVVPIGEVELEEAKRALMAQGLQAGLDGSYLEAVGLDPQGVDSWVRRFVEDKLETFADADPVALYRSFLEVGVGVGLAAASRRVNEGRGW